MDTIRMVHGVTMPADNAGILLSYLAIGAVALCVGVFAGALFLVVSEAREDIRKRRRAAPPSLIERLYAYAAWLTLFAGLAAFVHSAMR